MAVTGVVVLAFAPATALGKTTHGRAFTAHRHAAAPARAAALGTQILAFGAGYADVHGSALVRALQRRLAAAGYSPGPIDGKYGPLTEGAVVRFQADHGLWIDGIAGPQTLGALTRPLLNPGAGYADVHGSALVRALQRRLAAAGDSPGPIDGKYGPLTEHAVIKFQAAHRLRVDGIAGPRTFAALRSVGVRVRTRRSVRRAPAKVRPAARSVRRATRRARRAPSSNLPIGWVVLVAALGGGVLLAGITRTRLRRRARSRPAVSGEREPQPGANGNPPAVISGAQVGGEHAGDGGGAFTLAATLEQRGDVEGAIAAYRKADRLGHLGAACNLGVLLEQQGDLEGAEAAYRRAALGGDGNGAFNLASLLEQRGAFDEAKAAYGRADGLGHASAACNLGVLLEQQGDLEGAEAAYRRAALGGDPSGTFNLGIVLERRGEVASALEAFQRAASIGSPEVRSAAHAAAAELTARPGGPRAVERGGVRDG